MTTATDQYLSFESHHPVAHKRAMVRTLYSQADAIFSSGIGKNTEKQHIVKMLRKNVYPHRFVKKACMRAPRACSESSQEPLANISIPCIYVKGVLAEPIRQLLSELGIRVGVRLPPSLR